MIRYDTIPYNGVFDERFNKESMHAEVSPGCASAEMKKLSPNCGLAIPYAHRGRGCNYQFGFWELVLRNANNEVGDCIALCSSVCHKSKHWFG
jgi:hypothetical protein